MEAISFYCRQQAICIDADFSDLPPNYQIIFKFPTAGSRYRIRRLCPDDALLLEEIRNEVVRFTSDTKYEPGFHSERFKNIHLPAPTNAK
jgi:hypothetical protein